MVLLYGEALGNAVEARRLYRVGHRIRAREKSQLVIK
jgi:hypothetical protein